MASEGSGIVPNKARSQLGRAKRGQRFHKEAKESERQAREGQRKTSEAKRRPKGANRRPKEASSGVCFLALTAAWRNGRGRGRALQKPTKRKLLLQVD